MEVSYRRTRRMLGCGLALAVAVALGICCVEATAADGPYVTVPLDDVCNAAGPAEAASLPPAGQETLVEGIPFVFPTRDKDVDHVDVAKEAGVQLAMQAYRRAWILAACDGEPNSTSIMTLRLGDLWPLDRAVSVPDFTAQAGPEGARRIAVKMKDGAAASLWLLPVDIDSFRLASELQEAPALNVLLTKEIKGQRNNISYGYAPAGLPSGVRLYGLTFEKAPVAVIASSDRAGNVFTDPEAPVWLVDLASQSGEDCAAEVSVKVVDPYGAESCSFTAAATVPAGRQERVRFDPQLSKYGLHTVRTTVTCAGYVQSREGAFLLLAPDRRKADSKTTRWGLWNWAGAHATNPNPEDNLRLFHALGAKTGSPVGYEQRKKWGIGPRIGLYRGRMPGRLAPEWADKDPYDPAEYAEFSEQIGKGKNIKGFTPQTEYVAIYGEHTVSPRLTHGVPPYAFGLPWYEYTETEKQGIRSRFVGAKAAFEGLREHSPQVKGLFGWGAALFGVPFMREQFPKDLFDGFGLDIPQFEFMPEMPPEHRAPNILYFLTEEMKRWGYEDKEIVHCESYFPSSLPLALGHRGQADSVVRTAVLSMALGSDRFVWCWSLHDCADYWGWNGYGCVGMIGRRPEYNPKPAAAGFATMTQMLDMVDYDGYLPTGSRTAYCVRFKADDRLVYCLWTIRGSRPIALTASPGSELVMVDENGNQTTLADGAATVTITPTPIWVVAHGGEVRKAAVGKPTYTEEPGSHRLVLDDFDMMRWTRGRGPAPHYEEHTRGVRNVLAPMHVHRVQSPERKSGVMRVRLAQRPDDGAPFVSWYGTYMPPEPILIPGKARALGVWVKGNSGWGRILYELVDANGEPYVNTWDPPARSYFNFDGWRYIEFPLPANSPGDDFRENDSDWWWGHSAGRKGVVALPLKLTKIIFEMRTHQIYVDQVLPCESLAVDLDDLMAVYESAEMMTDKPVETQRAAAGLIK